MTQRPNIVLIMTDQQRFDSLGCCGSRFARTPNLDALAADSLNFRRCFTPHAVCMPSRASALSGLYPSAHGVWANGVPLARHDHVAALDDNGMVPASHPARGTYPSHVPLLTDALRDAGYHTASVGKLHLTPTHSHPSLGFAESTARWRENPELADWHGPYCGFDEVHLTLGHRERCGGPYGHWLEKHHPAAVASRDRAASGPKLRHDLYPGGLPIEAHPTTWIADQAAALIRRQAQSDNPTFLWVGFPDPHHPFTPPAELAREFESIDIDEPCTHECVGKPAAYRHITTGPGSMRVPRQIVRIMRQYTAAMVHLIDRAVGQIVTALKKSGQWDNTVLVFTSDHGDFLGDFGLAYKFPVADRTLNHVPLIVRLPQTPGRAVDAAVSNVDLAPTLCSLANTAMPAPVHGQDLLAVAQHGRSADWPVLIQHYGHGLDPAQVNFSLVNDRWRFTLYPATGDRELYDHRDDPCELRNLAAPDAPTDTEQQLHRALLEAQLRTETRNSARVALW